MGDKQRIKSLQTREYDALVSVVKEARKEKQISQEKLSALLSQSPNFMLKIEGQGRRLDVVEFYQIAQALGIPPKSLFDRFVEAVSQTTE